MRNEETTRRRFLAGTVAGIVGSQVEWNRNGLRQPNHLVIAGGSGAATVRYEFAVNGAVEPASGSGDAPIADRYVSFNDEDDISDGVVKGAVGGGADAYAFSGTITRFTVDGDATVFVNGKEMSPDTVGRGETSFAPKVTFECYSVEVSADSYDQVAIRTDDGTTFQFTSGYAGPVRFGYGGDGRVDESLDTDDFRGPIRAVTVRRGESTQTATRDDSVHCTWGADDISFARSTVETPGLADGSVTFADGTKKHYEYGVKPGSIGSPGRVVEAIESADPPATVYNPAPADGSGEDPATKIDCTKLVVGPEEFVAPKWDENIEEATLTGAKVTFVDGSTQTFGSEPVISRTPYKGEFIPPVTFKGTGEHAGKVIDSATVYGVNPVFYLELTNADAGRC